ncbi:PTS sugar transporter subunit IIA [Evansella cellulosilytica]|uniref:PTS system, glucose subfamily, IIA subunit n=1 Tax=Evansella cellulosilytica (strain ATCC 21833 / DSM 2522 / FERM P-1141 / JCM 9156 / N-4) TaxID=649639 RepID=E6TYI7_EVAC2|nr:PTS glucose transporter subunit IIA [Evansella cellulosilytica]ADU30037.1 PTS system, glucose subfamily, IIA subunit [Evansella cellulosilytica DSM 2522]
MFKKLFSKQKNNVQMPDANGEDTIFSPLNGKVVSLSQVPDPTFSQKMMGDGVAIMPSDGTVVSPVIGEIIQVFPTKHAIGIKTVNGVEVLIHIGLETVNLNGEGFTAFVKQGDKVAKGEKLISFDLDIINEKASSTITPIVITNGELVKSLKNEENGDVIAGKSLILTIST